MLLCNIDIIGEDGPKTIRIAGGRVQAVRNYEIGAGESENEISLVFDRALAFPGLINSHDHLDFNLYPRLGNRIYDNYADWGNDIHDNNKDEIDAIEKIPQQLRVKWGIY